MSESPVNTVGATVRGIPYEDLLLGRSSNPVSLAERELKQG